MAPATFVRRVGAEWNEMMAAGLVAILSILIVYFLAQNKPIGGIASVGIKERPRTVAPGSPRLRSAARSPGALPLAARS